MANINWAEIRQRELASIQIQVPSGNLEVPALPHAVTQFIERSVDPDVPTRELAAIVETDSGLTVELLKHVNSSLFNFSSPIRDVAYAISHLGLRQAKIFLITVGTKAASRSTKSKLIHQENFWNESLQKAFFARELAKLLKTDTELAFASSLLADFVLPATTNSHTDDYIGYLKSAQNNELENLCDFEYRQFGWCHSSVAALVGHQWNLPDDIVCCIFHHHSIDRIVADQELAGSAALPVALSACLPDQLSQTVNGRQKLADLNEKWNWFDLESVCEAVDEQVAQRNDVCGSRFPLSRVFESVFKAKQVASSIH